MVPLDALWKVLVSHAGTVLVVSPIFMLRFLRWACVYVKIVGSCRRYWANQVKSAPLFPLPLCRLPLSSVEGEKMMVP